MSYNFTKSPKQIITLEVSGVSLEIPLYGDLLAKEAEEIEKLSYNYQKWTQQLFKLAQSIAEKTKMPLIEVLACISEETTESQLEKLEGYLLPLLAHANSKPSEALKLQESALVILQSRVDKSIMLEDVKELPLEMVKQINDVIYQETTDSYLPLETIHKEHELMSEMVKLAETGIDECIKLINFLKKDADEYSKEVLNEVSINLSNYYTLKATLGK